MTSVFILFLCFVAALILAEVLSHVAFRMYYGVPFHDRRIANYPYADFVEWVDPPLHYIYKKGFRSRTVNTNRFRLRGADPAEDGVKRRVLVLGESNFFGAKLRDEQCLWSNTLSQLLIKEGHGDWEVLNGGSAQYNCSQHWHFWAGELERVKPEILIVSFGGNDISQMNVMGEKWNTQAHWPKDFLLKLLERKVPRWRNLLEPFCLYFFLRRIIKENAPPRFGKGPGQLPWAECKRHILDQYRKFCDDARGKGIRIAFTAPFGVYSRVVNAAEEKRLCAIQGNYRQSIDRDAFYIFDITDTLMHELCSELEVPYLDLKEDFDAYPRRFECWYDLMHWNERGMKVIAQSLYKRIHQLGWWN